MALNHSPSIVTNGLIFAYDMSNTQKSWKGAPTVNLITSPNPTTVGGAWGVTGLSAVTANAAIAPDGTFTATKLVASISNTTFQFISPTSSSQPTGTITYSCHMKAGEYTTGSLFLTQSGNNGAIFNLTNGTVVSVTGTGNTAAITPHPNGNGWWRCSVTNTGGTVSAGYRVGPLNGCLANVGGDGVSGIYVWNCQAEQQSFATPFVSGTRSTTQAIVDQTNNNTITASSLTYNSNNTFSFNGSTNHIITTNTGMSHGTANFSYSCWVNFAGLPGQGTIFENGFYTNGILIRFQSNVIAIYAQYSTTTYTNSFSFNPTLNVWYHLVITRVGNNLLLYSNGVLLSTIAFGTNINIIPSNNLMFIGMSQHYAGQCFNGLIGNVTVYNRALNALEVQQNFNALRGRYGL